MSKKWMKVRSGVKVSSLTGTPDEVIYLLRDGMRGAERQNAGATSKEEQNETAVRCRVYAQLMSDIFDQEEARTRVKQEKGM